MKKTKSMVLALASFVGRSRGKTFGLANEKAASKPDFKAMHAEAIGCANDLSDEDQVMAHHKHMAAVANEMETTDDAGEPTGALPTDNEKAEKEKADKLANEKKAADEAARIEAEKKAEEEKAKLANDSTKKLEAKAAGLLIANALAEGRIVPAAKTDWESKFANNFEATEALLAKETKKLKTVPVTKGLGKGHSAAFENESTRRARVSELVNEKMEKTKVDYTRAFNAVQNEHPELFDSMQKPELKK